MFSPKGLGLTIFKERYVLHPNESWGGASWRVAQHVARGDVLGTTEKFFGEIVENRFMPGGRIWFGSGRPNAQLLNCFVIPTGDSKEAWGKSVSDMLVVSATGGGVGGNFSPVRGRGYAIHGNGGVATGAVSLMQMWDRTGDVLVGGGGRRLALMLCLNIDHPDIEEFIETKLDLDQLTNANVSIVIPPTLDPVEFRRMVENDEQLPLTFNRLPDPQGRTISAKALWERIVQNAWQSGEPGVLNGYYANKDSNVWYQHPLISTNPCGEIWLPAYGCCCLGALVLPRFVSSGVFDWDGFARSVGLGVRFLDNVLTVNHYPLPEIAAKSQEERRIGLGVMGLHSALLDMGMAYSSDEAFSFTDRLFDSLKGFAYGASVDLAREKGPFPAYDERLLQSGFAKKLPRRTKQRIREHGLRNCALLTIAPTGTTSIVAGVTSGIEPLFSPVYIRRRLAMDSKARRKPVETLVVSEDYLDHPDTAEGAYDLTPRDHLVMQVTAQEHIDNAVSKTINLRWDYPPEELASLWLEFLPLIKGATFYREGSRENEPLQFVPAHRTKEVIERFQSEGKEIEYEGNYAQDTCEDGVCDI